MLKPKLDYALINKNWICEVLGFNIQCDFEDYFETYIELTLKENEEIKIFRFLNVSQIEFENRSSNHGNNLEITDCSVDGMEHVNLLVRGFIEHSGNFSFWANNIIEIKEHFRF